MRDRDGTKHDVLSAQEAMLRLAERVAIVPQEAAVLHDIRRRMVGEARA